MKKSSLALLVAGLIAALLASCATPSTEPPAPTSTATPQPEALATATPPPTAPPQPAATMPVLLIIAPQDFQPREYSETRRVLEEAGYTAVVASITLEEAVSMPPDQLKVHPDLTIGDVTVADYDAIIFIGGSGSTVYWDEPTAHRIAQEAIAQEKVLAAICLAPVTLAKAGVLGGKQATVFPSPDAIAMVQEGQATCTGEESVVRDGLIITGNGPEAATEFGEAIVAALKGQ